MLINDMLAIADAFKNNPSGLLSISKIDDTYTFKAETQISQVSIELFMEIIGKERLHAACSLPAIKLNSNNLRLTRSIVAKIFVGIMHLEPNLTESHDEISILFLEKIPKIHKHDYALNVRRKFHCLSERIFLKSLHRSFTSNNPFENHIHDIEFLTSRYADREPQKNDTVYLSKIPYKITEVFAARGSYIFILRDSQGQLPAKIVCRGTSARPGATEGFSSCINDMQLEIGNLGVQAVWPDLCKYLHENNIKNVELYGKSLGGAHAQMLAVLIEGVAKIKVENLSTYCSVGVSKAVHKLFKELVLNNRSEPFKVTVIRNGGTTINDVDYVPYVGGAHLGKNCETEVVYINDNESITPITKVQNVFFRFALFIRSFSRAHNRQTTLNSFFWKKIESHEISWHLNTGLIFENLRKVFSLIFQMLTLGILNSPSFTTFVKKYQKEPII